MAFWGVEVKPGKPYTHRYHSSHGRLRISQATLGSCDAAKRSVLQCVVGNKTPVIICSLNPRLAEMCHLEIELEEDDEVLFSVLGPSSVHLSGYYLRPGSRSGAGDDESESYGEDVGESDTDQDYDVSEDSYESDFIDDGDTEVPEDNDVSDSMNDGDVCSSPDHHKPASEKDAGKVKRQRRLKKKHQVDSTEDKIEDSSCDPTVRRKRSIFDSDSEDEDFLAKEEDLPALAKKTNGKVSKEIKTENVVSKEETKKESKNARKRKSDTINQDPASPMDKAEVNGSSVPKQEAELKKKSKKKKRTPSEEEDGKRSNNIRTLENGLVIEDLSAGNQDAKVASNGSKVYINYVGKLKDGETVHSNDKEKPYKFKLGAEKVVIPGWNFGIDGMHVGDKRRLTIPPSLCEKDGKSVGEAPKNSTIIYEVELVKVK
ncbi:unnamed protein product [Alopecurus aequalis]